MFKIPNFDIAIFHKTPLDMYRFAVTVSIRKGLGPEWFEKEFEVCFEDLDTPVSEEELKEWAKDDVRGQLRNTVHYTHYGDNWVITDVKKCG